MPLYRLLLRLLQRPHRFLLRLNPIVAVAPPVVEDVSPPAAETIVAAPVNEVAVQAAVETFAPIEIVQPPVIETVAPLAPEPEPAFEAIAPFEILPTVELAPVVDEIAPLEFEAVEPVTVEESTFEAIEIAAAVEPISILTPEPSVEIDVIAAEPAVQHFEPEAIVPLVFENKFPPLPEYVPPTPIVVIPEVPVIEAKADAAFAENFTYVPEPGKPEIQANLAAIDDAVKQEVAQRAIELELENIWRLMLAKPTSEDRIVYLREAAEIHASDDEWNKPEPEFDLSKIEPAVQPEITVLSLEPVAQDIVRENVAIVTVASGAEGQDLAELTRSLLDMMAAGNASGLPQERALAADTLMRLVPRLELKPLVMLAQRLAMMESPPNLLVSRLIRDPRVEVAGPLLEDCAHITDKDLEMVVEEGEPAKLRMIGRRRKLSRPISDALIKSGDPSVVLTLVRNMEAEISHGGFESLLVLCENHDELLAPLATRQDLSAPVAFELFWLAPAQLRRFILSRFLTDSETLTKILKITKMANSEDDGEVEPLSQHALLEALERAARGQIEIASEELAGIMQLNAAAVTRILGDSQGEAIIVMLKAAAYPRSSIGGLLKRMQDADLPLISRERDITELQSMFETLSFNKARILLTYWDWAQSKTGPYAPVH